MFVIGNNELSELPVLGKTVTCWICGQEHAVEYGEKIAEDGTRQPDDLLAFFKCGERSYLCGVKGKQLKKPQENIQYLDEYNRPVPQKIDHAAVGRESAASAGSVADRPLGDPEVAVEILKLRVAELEQAIRRLAEQDATLSVCEGNVTVTMDATLTDAERKFLQNLHGAYEEMANQTGYVNAAAQKEAREHAVLLKGLLEKHK